MSKSIKGVITMGILSLISTSCMIIVKRVRDGDAHYHRETPITSERIAMLNPGTSTEDEVKEIFENEYASQYTYRNRFLKKLYRGVEYFVDRIIIVTYVPNTVEDLGGGVRRHGWSDRLYLGAFFRNGILQYYTVTHDIKNEKGDIVWGPLDTGGNSKGEFYPGLRCDLALYEVFELGEKKRRYGDSYTEIFQECGIPEEEYRHLLKE